jgi:hypothetical protein
MTTGRTRAWSPLPAAVAAHLDRVRAEFEEMPGLCLTLDQARRLWQLDAVCCEAVLAELVAQRFVRRTHRGAFVRG